MPGKRITDQQYRKYMEAKKLGYTQSISSAKAGFSERSGRTLEKLGSLPSQRKRKEWKTRKDPFEDVWGKEIAPLLKDKPGLSAITLLEYLQDTYPDKYPDNLLRTMQRRVRKWRALYGEEQEVIFRQRHMPGLQGLSDFTLLKDVRVTIAGKPFKHLLYHFRLAYSGWSYIEVIQGGESFAALSKGLQDALWRLGGCPIEHRTDSLSAAFKNLSRDERKDQTKSYSELCDHYGMKPTRNNRGISHENGSIESPHGHIKRRLKQALLLRNSYDFATVSDYQKFIDIVVLRQNQRHKAQIDVERQYLKELPKYRTVDFRETTFRVTTSSTIIVQRVMYSVPSRLIGQNLRIHIYDAHLSCYLGNDHVLDLPRIIWAKNKKAKCIDYKHLIGSLSRKPQAFRYSILREELLPNLTYKKIWEKLDRSCDARHACKLMVGILKLAADYDCEQDLGEFVLTMLSKDDIPSLGILQKRYQPTGSFFLESSKVKITQHSLESYNSFLPSLTKEVCHA
jgi:transposase InsO family protein